MLVTGELQFHSPQPTIHRLKRPRGRPSAADFPLWACSRFPFRAITNTKPPRAPTTKCTTHSDITHSTLAMCRYSYVYYSYCDHAELTLLEYCSTAVAKAARLSHQQTHDGRQQHQSRPTDNEPGGSGDVSKCDTRAQRALNPANALQQHIISGGSGQDASGHSNTRGDAFQQQSGMAEEDVDVEVNQKGGSFRIQIDSPCENVLASQATSYLSPAARLAARFHESEQDPFIEKPAPGREPTSTSKSPFSYANILKTKPPETYDVTCAFPVPKKTSNITTEGAKQQSRSGTRIGKLFSDGQGPLAITTNLPQQRRSSDPAFDLTSPQAFPALSSKSSITAPPSAVDSGRPGRSSSWAQIARLTTSNEYVAFLASLLPVMQLLTDR